MDRPAQPGRGTGARARGRWAWTALVAGWVVTAGCFGFVYWRVHRAAAAQGLPVPDYLAESLDGVRWGPWLALMVPYSAIYLVLDAAVVTRVIGWSAAPVRYRQVLPLRAAAYVLSLLSEVAGKAGIALVLRQRHRIGLPAAASAMGFLMVGEFVSLCLWALVGSGVGLWIGGRGLPAGFAAVPWIAAAGLAAVTAGHWAITRTARRRLLAGRLPVLDAFVGATATRYAEVVLLRAPLMVTGFAVYTLSLRWFGVPVGVGEVAAVFPVVLLGAAVPGPLRVVPAALWVIAFPQYPAQLAAFGLLQHVAFVVINALLGLAFVPAALRAVSRPGPATAPAAASTPPS